MSDDAPLRIEPIGASEPRARIEDHLWGGPGEDRADWCCDDGERWRITTSITSEGDTRTRRVDQVRAGTDAPTDHLLFRMTDERFAELGRDGEPYVDLPAALNLDDPHALGSSGTVRLAHAGPVRLLLEDRVEQLHAIALVARVDDVEHVQWLGEGVGELLIGPQDGPPIRWLVGWSGGDRHLFGEES